MAKASGVETGGKKRRYIQYKVDSLQTSLRDRFLPLALRRRPIRENCESCFRFLNFTRFCLGCSASIVQMLGPWVLSTIELVAVLLTYFLGISRALLIHEAASNYSFNWMCSLEDIVGLAIVRSVLLSVTYAWGAYHAHSAGCAAHRTYLYTSYLLCAACFPYIVVKIILYRYGQDAIPAAAILLITGGFCWLHVFAARRTVEVARRRYQMGLSGFSYPWEEGEDISWSALRRPDVAEMSKCSDRSGGLLDSSGDVPAESLADADSRFIDVAGIKVHYKEVWPSGLSIGGRSPSPGGSCCSGSSDNGSCDQYGTGIVLVHGFGGGVFAWRHVMEALALQCQCRVIAFDRPGFGLTSRPLISHDQRLGSSNPYSMCTQAELMMQLCSQLGLRKVLLLAHGDACLLALRAASLAERAAEHEVAASAAGTTNEGYVPAAGRHDSPSAGPGLGPPADISLCVSSCGPDATAASGSSVGPPLSSACAHTAITIHTVGVAASQADRAAGCCSRASFSSPTAADGCAFPPLSGLRRRTPSSANFFPEAAEQPSSSQQTAVTVSPGAAGSSSALDNRGGGSGPVDMMQPTEQQQQEGPDRSSSISSAAGLGPYSLPSAPHPVTGIFPPICYSGTSSSAAGVGGISAAAQGSSFSGRGVAQPFRGTAVSSAAVGGGSSPASSRSQHSSCDGSASRFEGPKAFAAASYALGALPSGSFGSESEIASAAVAELQPVGCRSAPSLADDAPSTSRSRHHSRPEPGPAQLAPSCSTGFSWGRLFTGGQQGAPADVAAVSAAAPSSSNHQGPRHRRCVSLSGPVPQLAPAGATFQDPMPAGGLSAAGEFVAAAASSSQATGPWPQLLGLALLHPNLVGQTGPTLSRLLASSTFGRSILRPMLRSEVGEVANRRAWHHAERLTPEVLELYKSPLRVEGWDMALMETARLSKEHTQGDLAAHMEAARKLPMLVVTASHDYIATPAKVERLCRSMPEAQSAVLADCGHLSHEEAPGVLLQELMPFCGQVLLPHQP